MSWRFGLHDSTFEPLWSTHWALLVVLLLPTLIGLLGIHDHPQACYQHRRTGQQYGHHTRGTQPGPQQAYQGR